MVNNNESVIIAMLEEIITSTKNNKSQQVDLSKIEKLTDKLQQVTETTTSCMEEVNQISEQVRLPIKTKHYHTFDICSSRDFFLLMVLFISTLTLAYMLKTERDELYTLRNNDLKYRYIKMKGEATPKHILKLEEIFELSENGDQVKQMRKDVNNYESVIKEKIILEEQVRLKNIETKKLNEQVNYIKSK